MDNDDWDYLLAENILSEKLYRYYKYKEYPVTSNKISTKPITSSKVKGQVLENSAELGVDIVQKINNTQHGE